MPQFNTGPTDDKIFRYTSSDEDCRREEGDIQNEEPIASVEVVSELTVEESCVEVFENESSSEIISGQEAIREFAQLRDTAARMRRHGEEYFRLLGKKNADNDVANRLRDQLIDAYRAEFIKERKALSGLMRLAASEYDAMGIHDFVEQWNAAHERMLKGAALTVARKEESALAFVDAEGSLTLREMNQSQVRDVLDEIKAIDNKLEGLGNSYELRRTLLEYSKGTISTAEAFLYAEEEAKDWSKVWSVAGREMGWLPERMMLHRRIFAEALVQAIELSGRIPERALLMLRGNTASGKTTAVRSDPMSKGVINPRTGHADGVINPDVYKAQIVAADAHQDGTRITTHAQTHVEGSTIAGKLITKLTEDGHSAVVIDRRHLSLEDVEEQGDRALKMEAPAKMIDVDAPLLQSLIGVLMRNPGGEDPLVAFDVVASGYVAARARRSAVIKHIVERSQFGGYNLYVREGSSIILVAKKMENELLVMNEHLFLEAVPGDGDNEDLRSEIKHVAERIIDEQFISEIVSTLSGSYADEVASRLRQYRGKTFAEVLDARALLMNENR